MTAVTKAVTRLTRSTLDGRDIIVTLHPTFLEFRFWKNRKRVYTLDITGAMQSAIRLEVRRQEALNPNLKKKKRRRR